VGGNELILRNNPLNVSPAVGQGQCLASQLSSLGVGTGSAVIVHASMRAVGEAAGRSETLLDGLLNVLGPQGTLVVPTFTPENSDTSSAHLERVRGLGKQASAQLRDTMPAFNADTTPAPSMGIFSETVRKAPGAQRSEHPQTSFAALGRQAEEVVANHARRCHLGEDSPLARLYDLDARVLLLGVGFDVCSAFHLAEYRLPKPPRRTYRCVVSTHGERHWWEYEDVVLDDSDFGALGADFESSESGSVVLRGQVGAASCRLLPLRDAVDYAVEWLSVHRKRVDFG